MTTPKLEQLHEMAKRRAAGEPLPDGWNDDVYAPADGTFVVWNELVQPIFDIPTLELANEISAALNDAFEAGSRDASFGQQ